MARVVPFHHTAARQAVAPFPRTRTPVARPTAVGAILFVLAVVGSFVVDGTLRLQGRLDAWAQARRERAEDRQLWDLARTDPRLMSELVALQQHAESQAR